MIDDLKEECAVAAIQLKKPIEKYPFGGASYYLYQMLLQMQNRGQLSSGITTYDANRLQLIDTRRKIGSVNDLFAANFKPKMEAILSRYAGTAGIGHNRYATFGGDDEGSAQPFERHHGRKWKWVAFAFNGNLANFSELKKELDEKQYHLVRNLDTEVLQHFLEKAQIGGKRISLFEIFKNLTEKLDGGYCIVYIDADGNLAVVRDPMGIRPLCYVEDENLIAVASESIALSAISDGEIKFIKPGEMLLASKKGMKIRRYTNSEKKAHCMFEWVYFANATSTIDGVSVYQTRRDLGVELAHEEILDVNSNDFVVVPVPDTSKAIADSYSYALGIPQVEGLVKNRYIGRTFIMSGDRSEKIRQKFIINPGVIKGKKVILIDDSIVRGTTIGVLIKYLREKGDVKEIHLRIACPPIRSPCFYGIDMSTIGELIVNKYSNNEQRKKSGFADVDKEIIDKICKAINADSLHYMSLEGLVRAIGKSKDELCMACITGDYPTKWGNDLRVKALENYERGLEVKRTYE